MIAFLFSEVFIVARFGCLVGEPWRCILLLPRKEFVEQLWRLLQRSSLDTWGDGWRLLCLVQILNLFILVIRTCCDDDIMLETSFDLTAAQDWLMSVYWLYYLDKLLFLLILWQLLLKRGCSVAFTSIVNFLDVVGHLGWFVQLSFDYCIAIVIKSPFATIRGCGPCSFHCLIVFTLARSAFYLFRRKTVWV